MTNKDVHVENRGSPPSRSDVFPMGNNAAPWTLLRLIFSEDPCLGSMVRNPEATQTNRSSSKSAPESHEQDFSPAHNDYVSSNSKFFNH
eukprot:2630991-Amphidinium_carterae.1